MTKRNYMEIQWQGRAGQGAVSAANMLAEIMAMEGKYVQAFPEFIAQIRRSLVLSYNRISNDPIKTNASVVRADIVVLMNSNLLINPEVKKNASENATYIVNTKYNPEFVKEKLNLNDDQNRILTVNADSIALEQGGGCTVPNVPLLSVLVNSMELLAVDRYQEKLQQSLSQRLSPEIVQANLNLIERALNEVSEL